jgi:parvulin-like peptidyl-prolyl isomerase
LGWIAPGAGQLAWPELEEALVTAPVGVLRTPVRSAVGYHLLQVTAREMRALGPAELARLREASLVAWMKKLRADASVEYFP